VPRFISVTIAVICAVALVSSGVYVLARWYDVEGVARATAHVLEASLYVLGAAGAYAILIGVYHTVLSVTGLDEEREGDGP
jgi:hypothetical protein